MSRFRARTASSPLDQEVQAFVVVAERALQNALRVCGRHRKDETYGRGHVARVRRDLERALHALSGVRNAQPRFDTTDIDLQPEPDEPEEQVPDDLDDGGGE